MRLSLLLTALALCVGVLGPVPTAHAAGPDKSAPVAPKRDSEAKARAQKLFERGIAAYKDGRYKDAIDAFLDAHREYPSPTLSFNTARAYDKMGDNAGALRFYREYLRQSLTATDRPAVEQVVGELEKKLQERGVQQVTVLSSVEGATVVVDDHPVGVTPWTGEISPGTHTLKLRREGYQDTEQGFELEAQRALDVNVSMEAAKETPKPLPSASPGVKSTPAPLDTGKSGGVSVWTWTAFGVGAAALSGALAFELMRESAQNDVKNEPTQLARYDAYDRMQSRQTTARVLAGVGAVATVAGGVLLYLDLSKGGKSKDQVGFGCGSAGCGAELRGRW